MPARAAKTDAGIPKSGQASQKIKGSKATAYHVYGQVRDKDRDRNGSSYSPTGLQFLSNSLAREVIERASH